MTEIQQMTPQLLRIFQEEVHRQCRFAHIAVSHANRAFAERNLEVFWYSVQAFLIAAGNVSKLLWPGDRYKPLVADRHRLLRESLSVLDESPLRNRELRNHFEHFDERLEQWATSSRRHNLIDDSVGDADSFKGFDPGDFLRFLDTKGRAIVFRGATYPIQPLVDAIAELELRAAAAVGRG